MRRRDLLDVDDAVLVRLVAEHDDEQALRVLIDRHTGWARRVAYGVWNDPLIAADATADAWVDFWRNSDRFDPARGSFRTWFATVVRHKTIDLRACGVAAPHGPAVRRGRP